MQGTYTVTKAQQTRTYQGKYGEMVVWQVRLADATTTNTDGVFELHKKPGNEPKPGDSLEVERSQEGEFDGSPFVRLFLAKPPQSGGGQSYGGGARSGGRDDATGQSIERQTAAKVAGEMAAAAGPGSVGMPQVLLNFEQAFDMALGKIQGAGQASQGASNGGGQEEIPADRSGLAPAATAPSGDDSIPF
jgi:hypothetical protein